jgi:hypothetical protein
MDMDRRKRKTQIERSCGFGNIGVLVQQALYHLSHSTSPVSLLGIFKIGSLELFP